MSAAPVTMMYNHATYDGQGNIFFTNGWTNELYRYNIIQNSWSRVSSLPEAMRSGICVYDKGNLYITAGQHEWNEPVSTHLYKFDMQTSSWTRMTDSPIPIAGSTGFNDLKGGIIITPGWGSSDYTGMYRYDINSNDWLRIGDQSISVGGIARSGVVFDGTSAYYTEGSGVGVDRPYKATNNFFRYDVASVPEPSSLLGLILGLAGIAGIKKGRK